MVVKSDILASKFADVHSFQMFDLVLDNSTGRTVTLANDLEEHLDTIRVLAIGNEGVLNVKRKLFRARIEETFPSTVK